MGCLEEDGGIVSGRDEPVRAVVELVGIVQAYVVLTIEGMVQSPPEGVCRIVVAPCDEQLVLITEAVAKVGIDLTTAI